MKIKVAATQMSCTWESEENISKAKKQLNWRPKLNFDKSIKFTVDWYKIFNSKDIENFTNDQINEYNSIK